VGEKRTSYIFQYWSQCIVLYHRLLTILPGVTLVVPDHLTTVTVLHQWTLRGSLGEPWAGASSLVPRLFRALLMCLRARGRGRGLRESALMRRPLVSACFPTPHPGLPRGPRWARGVQRKSSAPQAARGVPQALPAWEKTRCSIE